MDAEATKYAVKVPHLGSLILTHSWDGEIRGLKSFPKGVMRTTDTVSPVTAQQVGESLLAFVIVYTIVFDTGIYYLLKPAEAAGHGPALHGSHTQAPSLPGGAHRPLGVPGQSIEGA
ncbi:putative Cytochrome bd2, subunit I [Candidatus Paraburkholderia calva]|nr:putative Cytochrome bd2, subunit I [Candidatus Paraburkholderia calva]